jgi:uncharacterized repeat protein (TIGR01451 family)
LRISATSLFAVVFFVGSAFAGKIRYTYDAAGRLVAEDFGGGAHSTYVYDRNGNLLTNATAVAASADLRIPSISGTAVGANAGGSIAYNIIVTNTGPDVATAVVLTDPLPFGIVPTGAGSSQGACVTAGRLVTCNLGVLLPGAAATVSITGLRGVVGSFTNVVTVAGAVPDPNPANNTAQVVNTATAPFDADGDGIPNWWETLHFGSNFGAQPAGDADGDGVTDLDEWLADTNPRDPTSFFRVEGITLGVEGVTVTFPTSPIRRYVGRFSDTLLPGAFTGFVTHDGTGATMTITDTNTPSRARFYQVEAQVP